MTSGDPASRESSLTALVKAAQAHGLRIVALDSDASYAESMGGPGASSTPRMVAMNYEAVRKIAQEKKGKWVALVGSAHMNVLHEKSVLDNETTSTPGVAELTGAVALAVSDGESQEPTLRHDMAVRTGAMQTRLDHHLALPADFNAKTRVVLKVELTPNSDAHV